ncbi:MAG: hypothetical protein FWF97_00680 [Alphaproteobacteria bacterium]|nr:hypothetical protein [Alphaproteobacteria bacterium]
MATFYKSMHGDTRFSVAAKNIKFDSNKETHRLYTISVEGIVEYANLCSNALELVLGVNRKSLNNYNFNNNQEIVYGIRRVLEQALTEKDPIFVIEGLTSARNSFKVAVANQRTKQ